MRAAALYRESLAQAGPPAGLTLALQALWWVGRGDWAEAHRLASSDEGDPDCNLVHAHLHRVEGDRGNARYWDARANRSYGHLSIEAEWEAIAADLLAERMAAP